MNEADRFLELIENSKKLIYKVCFTYGRTESVRNDLFQEIVLQVWRSFQRYDDSKKFSTWMYRIALNTAISFVRKEQKRIDNEVPMEQEFVHVAVQTESIGGDGDLTRLHQWMEKLDEIDKAIMLLKLEGKNHSEIGDVLGTSTSNVGTRFNRIKNQIQKTNGGRENE